MNAMRRQPEDLQSVRTRLLRLRRLLTGAVQDDWHGMVAATDGGDNSGDFERSATALREEELDLHLARLGSKASDLAAVDTALAALENGSYGLCRDCGEEIGQQRLALNPAAQCCLPCAQAREKSRD